MSSQQVRDGSSRARSESRRSAARNLSRAVAERERGRRRLNATTATVGFASVVTAGVVAVVLPGSTHKTATSSNSSSSSSAASQTGGSSESDSGSSDSAGSSNTSNSSNGSGSLQAPASTPVQSGGGGGQITSGGS